MPLLRVELEAGRRRAQLVLVGSHSALGWWDPGRGAPLKWTGTAWETEEPVSLEGHAGLVECKFVRLDGDEPDWEEGPCRRLEAPTEGPCDVLLDATLNQQAHIVRALEEEEVKQRAEQRAAVAAAAAAAIAAAGRAEAKCWQERATEASRELDEAQALAASEIRRFAEEERQVAREEEALRSELALVREQLAGTRQQRRTAALHRQQWLQPGGTASPVPAVASACGTSHGLATTASPEQLPQAHTGFERLSSIPSAAAPVTAPAASYGGTQWAGGTPRAELAPKRHETSADLGAGPGLAATVQPGERDRGGGGGRAPAGAAAARAESDQDALLRSSSKRSTAPLSAYSTPVGTPGMGPRSIAGERGVARPDASAASSAGAAPPVGGRGDDGMANGHLLPPAPHPTARAGEREARPQGEGSACSTPLGTRLPRQHAGKQRHGVKDRTFDFSPAPWPRRERSSANSDTVQHLLEVTSRRGSENVDLAPSGYAPGAAGGSSMGSSYTISPCPGTPAGGPPGAAGHAQPAAEQLTWVGSASIGRPAAQQQPAWWGGCPYEVAPASGGGSGVGRASQGRERDLVAKWQMPPDVPSLELPPTRRFRG